jgi:hypothetical protein
MVPTGAKGGWRWHSESERSAHAGNCGNGRIPEVNEYQLRKLFEEFNRRYFGNRLPPYAIRVAHSPTSLGESGSSNRKRKLIKIASGQPAEREVSTLLHEMAHAATTDYHGMPWKREMIRLRKAGAPLAEPDNRVRLEDWSGVRVSKQDFREAMEDAVSGLPKIGLTQAIRHFIYNEGGPGTVGTFLKRYPWVREVLRQVKREYAEDEVRRLKLMQQNAAQRLQPTDGGNRDGEGNNSEAQQGEGKPA